MARVFLHIGMNKTGTSSIQNFFSLNRERAKSRGLIYPLTGCNIAAGHKAHHELERVLRLGYRTKGHAKKSIRFRELLDQEIREASPDAVLISSEFFATSTLQLDGVRNFFMDDDLRIILYLRRHDTWWESFYNQTIKTTLSDRYPWGIGFNAFVRFRKQQSANFYHYRHLVDRWANAFGQEHVIVRPYERQQYAPDIVVDILRAMGIDLGIDPNCIPQLLGIRSLRHNASLSPLSLRLIQILPHANIEPAIRARLLKYALSLPPTEPRQSLLSPARRLQLIEQNAADYEYIAREYLGRPDGRLFYDPLPDPHEPWEPIKPLAPWQIVEETVKALAENPQDTVM